MNKMLFAGIAIIILLVFGFLMFKNKPKATEVDLYSQNKEAASSPLPTEVPVVDNTKTDMMQLPKPALTIDKTKTYQALLHTTEGDITIDLYGDKTPITANNFIYLANNHFYDNTIFHRVISGFMIQGGDPTGTGAGGPGYKFDDEPFTGEYTKGTVAMANAGPNTNGSQFFIMHADYALPKAYVIFGKVSAGLEVVDKIAAAETTISMGGEKSKPLSPVKITSVEITQK